MNTQSTEDFQGSVSILHDAIVVVHVIVHFSKPIECTISNINSNVSNRLWVIVMFNVGSLIATNVPSWWLIMGRPGGGEGNIFA